MSKFEMKLADLLLQGLGHLLLDLLVHIINTSLLLLGFLFALLWDQDVLVLKFLQLKHEGVVAALDDVLG